MQLSDIAIFVEQSIRSTDICLSEYVTTDSILQNREGRTMATNLPPTPCNLTSYQPGDILMANIRPYLKKVWMADTTGGCSADVLVFRAKENVSSEYLYSVLLQDSFFAYVMLAPKGSKMPRGDKDHIMRFPICDLPNEDSIKVGDLICKIEAKLANNRKQNVILEKLAKQIYDYWFVQFDFPNEEGKPYKSSGGKMVWNETLKRDIPDGWNDDILDNLLALEDNQRVPLSSQDRAGRKGIFPYYGATGIMDYVNDYIFDGDYLLLAEDGSTSDKDGYPIVQYIWGKTWVNNHAHVITPKNKSQLIYYYYLLKKIPAMKIESGSIQKKISQKNLLSYPVLCPHTSLVDDFCRITYSVKEKQKKLTEEINELLSLRNYLLPLLMNGQVTIKD